eukprot:460124-Amphidinium_carterae.1
MLRLLAVSRFLETLSRFAMLPPSSVESHHSLSACNELVWPLPQRFMCLSEVDDVSAQSLDVLF